jgi:hypothetical protein
LLAAARLGNATAYTGFAIGALLLTMYLCLVAGKTLLDSVLTLNTTVQSATGLSVTQPIELATTVGAAALTGGATMAVAGLAASEQTKSNTYALGAMAGRIPGMAEIGEVAAAMGWLDTDGAAYSGLYAGERSKHNWRSFRLQAERDAERFVPDDEANLPSRTTTPPTHRTPMPPQISAELSLDQLGGGAQRLILAADLAQARTDPLLRASALHLNEQQQVVYTERASYPTLAALHAATLPRGEANIPRLLMGGYHVQENPDEGTVSYWKPGKSARAGAAAGTEGPLSSTPEPDGSAAPAAPVAASANDGLARIEGQIATLSAQIAGLHTNATAPATGSAGGAYVQLEQIEAAIDQSRLATNAEQDELERAIAPAGQPTAIGTSGPSSGEAITRSGGLTPISPALERNQALLSHLDGEITAAQHALDQIGQAQDADAQAQRAQLERTLSRLRTARTAVEQRAARTAQAPSRPSEETEK